MMMISRKALLLAATFVASSAFSALAEGAVTANGVTIANKGLVAIGRIPANQRDKFKPSPEELEGRDVCIIGTITRDNSRAEIAVTSPANIKLATIK